MRIDAYASAWAVAYHLWPGYRAGDKFPAKLSIGPFSPRVIPIDFEAPEQTQSLLSRKEINELELEFRNQFPNANQPVETETAQAEANFLEGLRLSDLGQTLQAIPLLEKACALRPSNSTWWNALALAYQENKQTSEARQAIEKALATAKNETESAAAKSLQKSIN
jgi:tetratricopeptide (TPR) repeat protein